MFGCVQYVSEILLFQSILFYVTCKSFMVGFFLFTRCYLVIYRFFGNVFLKRCPILTFSVLGIIRIRSTHCHSMLFYFVYYVYSRLCLEPYLFASTVPVYKHTNEQKVVFRKVKIFENIQCKRL